MTEEKSSPEPSSTPPTVVFAPITASTPQSSPDLNTTVKSLSLYEHRGRSNTQIQPIKIPSKNAKDKTSRTPFTRRADTTAAAGALDAPENEGVFGLPPAEELTKEEEVEKEKEEEVEKEKEEEVEKEKEEEVEKEKEEKGEEKKVKKEVKKEEEKEKEEEEEEKVALVKIPHLAIEEK